MRRALDRLHLEFPLRGFANVARACWLPRGARSAVVNVKTLMRADGDRGASTIAVPRTTKPEPGAIKIFP